MPSKENMILEFNQCLKSNEEPFLIYAGRESLITKISGFRNNSGKSSTDN